MEAGELFDVIFLKMDFMRMDFMRMEFMRMDFMDFLEKIEIIRMQ